MEPRIGVRRERARHAGGARRPAQPPPPRRHPRPAPLRAPPPPRCPPSLPCRRSETKPSQPRDRRGERAAPGAPALPWLSLLPGLELRGWAGRTGTWLDSKPLLPTSSSAYLLQDCSRPTCSVQHILAEIVDA
ncbi:translation initiation factor IF-2-like [Manacus candei]|uniref:translation initiation factor IF-2-like n=1 Tax=Manacus candei TaxID=415023 RepID=UPI0022271E6F|nr:translation initiation factor IF-2-like [Manacus candei]